LQEIQRTACMGIINRTLGKALSKDSRTDKIVLVKKNALGKEAGARGS
jgi:hypothetical protein